MKFRKILLTLALCAMCVGQASALEYTYDAPEDYLFGRPTSLDAPYTQEDPNVDRSKDVALVPPGFGTPTSYLPGSGEALTPNLVPGALKVGLVNQVGSVNYLVKVFAFPDVTSDEYSMSTAASSSYTYTGVQSAPQIAYYWNTFDGTVGIQVANMEEYLYQAYPDRVDVTFTNMEDNSDTVTVSIEGISPDNFSAQLDELTRNATYQVTAVATSSSDYVTNSTSDTATVADALLLGSSHQFTEGYSYNDNFTDNNYNWPILCSNFDLNNGGVAGTAPSRTGTLTLDLTPQPAADGAAYHAGSGISQKSGWPIVHHWTAFGLLSCFSTCNSQPG